MHHPLAVYIHWPFCKAKCPYCDFNSHVREGVDQHAWREALLAEMAHMAAHTLGRRVGSIFFGGGTPSLMPSGTVEALIDGAAKHWALADDAEITLEANPTSVEAAAFKGFREAGVNRVSLGVQALCDAALTFLGRQHSAREALQAVELAANIFPRYSFDLIYARPGQTLKAWEAELKEALQYADGHLSLYQLTIEENTAFHTAHAKGAFIMPEEDNAATLYQRTQAIMEQAGLPAYEISNHARPGQESRHNIAYWKGAEYVGIGPGAHGRIDIDLRSAASPLGGPSVSGPTASESRELRATRAGPALASLASRRSTPPETIESSRVATQTIKSPERWLEAVKRQGHGLEAWQALEPEQAREERLMMRLRLISGFPRGDMPFIRQQNIERLRSHGLLAPDTAHIQTTLAGRLLLNVVTAELMA